MPPLPPRPLLVVVRGKPGAGKTTLARRLAAADALALPVLHRDALKAGLVASYGEESAAVRAAIVPRSFDRFFATVALWLRGGVSLIAEHSLIRAWNEEALRAVLPLARVVILSCDAPDAVAARRFVARERALPGRGPGYSTATIGQMARGTFDWRRFDPFPLGVPELRVDTTVDYQPDLDAILAFCRGVGGSDAAAGPGRTGDTGPHAALDRGRGGESSGR